MKQILTDEEIKDILNTEDWYNFPQDAIRAAEQRILEKIGEAVGTVDAICDEQIIPTYRLDRATSLYAIPFIKEGE